MQTIAVRWLLLPATGKVRVDGAAGPRSAFELPNFAVDARPLTAIACAPLARVATPAEVRFEEGRRPGYLIFRPDNFDSIAATELDARR